MPNTHEVEKRRRMKRRAILSSLVLAGLILLLVFAPTRMLGWSGFGFGTLTVPEATIVSIEEPVAAAVKPLSAPAVIEPLTFPAYAEWSDLETACTDCDWSFSYGIGGDLDAVDNEMLSRLEHSAGVAAGAGAVSRASGPGGSSFGGGGFGGGAGAPGAAGAQETSTEPAIEDATEPASDDAAPRATKASVGSSDSGGSSESNGNGGSANGGSSAGDGESSSGGSSAPETVTAGAPPTEDTTPDLILSRITPSDEPAGSLPQDVVQALVDAPVGSETVHSGGEPEVISDALSLEDGPAASSDGGGGQQDVVPEPVSLLLVGLGLSAGVWRHRTAR